MEPGIKDGQTLTYKDVQPGDLKRGDIIVFGKDGNKIIRRLVGMPNDTVEIRDGVVYINDQPLNEPYTSEPKTQTISKLTLASEEYFVMADNRSNGIDSRDYGPIKAGDILGRVVLEN